MVVMPFHIVPVGLMPCMQIQQLVFLSQVPTSRRHWNNLEERVSIKRIRSYLQLADTQWYPSLTTLYIDSYPNAHQDSVHHGGFPEVSPDSAVTPNNTNGGVNFDTTHGGFDTRVVSEYMDGTGQGGGPLVTSFNETSRSDLRLFESDGNKTMKALYHKRDGFQDTCSDIMGRMINTVPFDVRLQDAITPFPIKPINVTWDFNQAGQLYLSGNIRVGLSNRTKQFDLTVYSL